MSKQTTKTKSFNNISGASYMKHSTTVTTN